MGVIRGVYPGDVKDCTWFKGKRVYKGVNKDVDLQNSHELVVYRK